jgi:hypothetical protein
MYPAPRAEVEYWAAVRGRQDSQHRHGVKELAVSWHKKPSKHKNEVTQLLPLGVRQAREMEECGRKAEKWIRETAAEPRALKVELIKLKAEIAVAESEIASEVVA